MSGRDPAFPGQNGCILGALHSATRLYRSGILETVQEKDLSGCYEARGTVLRPWIMYTA